MKKLFLLLFLFCMGKGFAQNTVWNQPAFTGSMTGVRFLVGVGPTSTRHVTYETIISTLDARYLQSYTETDPVWAAAAVNYYTKTQADGRYLQSFTEADPTVPAGVKAITATNISNWNSAFGWGNHASAGYLTAVSGTNLDNVFSSVGLLKRTGVGTYVSITDNSSNWNTAFNKSLASMSVTGTNTKTITLTLNDATTITASFSDLQGTGGGSTLASMSDVNITSPQDLQLLKYDNATSKWVNFTSAFLTQNQTITLSGDISGSGSTAITTTIGSNKVTLSMMAQVATATFLGRTTAATGNVEALTVAQAKTLLNLTGTNSGDQTITLTGDVTGSGTGSFAATIGANKVTNSQLAQMAANTLKGNNTGVTANALDLTVSQVKTMLSLNNVENTALSTWGGSTSIVTLGTITTGTWQGTAIANTYIASASTWNAKQNAITLTTTGTSGAATFDGTTLNIPQYTGGGGSGDMILASVQTVTGAKTFNAGTLIAGAGTSADEPLLFTSGTNLTTAIAGAIEYNGITLQFTPISTQRGYVPARQIVTAQAAVTLSNATGAQPVFAAGNDAVSLAANTTYRFEAVYSLTTGVTATAVQAAFAYTGTMVIRYWVNGNKVGKNALGSGQTGLINTAALTAVTPSNGSAGTIVRISGEIRTTTAGTLTPQIGFVAAPGSGDQTDQGSYFEIWPVGTDTFVSIGAWQ
jgi:hypothetical protein